MADDDKKGQGKGDKAAAADAASKQSGNDQPSAERPPAKSAGWPTLAARLPNSRHCAAA